MEIVKGNYHLPTIKHVKEIEKVAYRNKNEFVTA